MSDYDEHPSKVSAWRGGRFVVFPDAAENTSAVWFGVGPTGPEGLTWEALACRPLTEHRVRICAIPFWLYDLNLGDEVTVTRSAEGELVATGVAVDAGNVTFRAFFTRDDAWQAFMRDLEPFECWFDVRTPTYIAIACPAGRAAQVADELQRREDRAELQFETGRTA